MERTPFHSRFQPWQCDLGALSYDASESHNFYRKYINVRWQGPCPISTCSTSSARLFEIESYINYNFLKYWRYRLYFPKRVNITEKRKKRNIMHIRQPVLFFFRYDDCGCSDRQKVWRFSRWYYLAYITFRLSAGKTMRLRGDTAGVGSVKRGMHLNCQCTQ